MRRIFAVLITLLLCVEAQAAVVPNNVSGSTVQIYHEPVIVTFSSVTKRIWVWSDTVNYDVYMDLKCNGPNGQKTGYSVTPNCVVLIPAGGSVTPNVVEMEFATKNLGFVCDGENIRVTYFVTGEVGEL